MSSNSIKHIILIQMTVEFKGMSYELCHHHRKSETWRRGGVQM